MTLKDFRVSQRPCPEFYWVELYYLPQIGLMTHKNFGSAAESALIIIEQNYYLGMMTLREIRVWQNYYFSLDS